MGKKNRPPRRPHGNKYENPAKRTGVRERERRNGLRAGIMGISEPEYRETMITPQIYREEWQIPRELVLDETVWRYDSSVPVVKERESTVGGYETWLGTWIPDKKITVRETEGYRGKYFKEKELTWGEARQRERDAESEARKQARKKKNWLKNLNPEIIIRF